MTPLNPEEARYSRTDVYLNSSAEKPKHLFVELGNRIGKRINPDQRFSLLDVGGASGAFASYMALRFPFLSLTCLDADQALIEMAAGQIPGVRFLFGDANLMNGLVDDEFSLVTMTGTMSIFDDFKPSMGECLRVCKKGGRVFVTGQFNEYPIDALIQWRYSGDTGKFNRGYNLFSKQTVSAFLETHPKVRTWEYERFVLPFDLEPQEDLIRTWTEKDGQGRRIFKNGLQMEINLQILEIRL
jgi:ubiquinone/menaquinone biosynthesis C-methylase UbiE